MTILNAGPANYRTLIINGRKVNPFIPDTIVYKVTFARPTVLVGRGKSRREHTRTYVVYCHATDTEQAVRVGKREVFAGFHDDIKYGPAFAETTVKGVQKTLNGRVL